MFLARERKEGKMTVRVLTRLGWWWKGELRCGPGWEVELVPGNYCPLRTRKQRRVALQDARPSGMDASSPPRRSSLNAPADARTRSDGEKSEAGCKWSLIC